MATSLKLVEAYKHLLCNTLTTLESAGISKNVSRNIRFYHVINRQTLQDNCPGNRGLGSVEHNAARLATI